MYPSSSVSLAEVLGITWSWAQLHFSTLPAPISSHLIFTTGQQGRYCFFYFIIKEIEAWGVTRGPKFTYLELAEPRFRQGRPDPKALFTNLLNWLETDSAESERRTINQATEAGGKGIFCVGGPVLTRCLAFSAYKAFAKESLL